MELFASQQQHIRQLYCSKHLNNAFHFFWKAMGLAYANPPFSLLAKVLTKITYEGGSVVMCTPDWGCSGEDAYWRHMLDRMTVGEVQLPNDPICVPKDSETAMQAPEWASFVSFVDGSMRWFWSWLSRDRSRRKKKPRKRHTTRKKKAQNRFFRPQKPRKEILCRCSARSQNLGHSQKEKNNRVATATKLSVACPKTPSKVRVLGARDLCALPQRRR